jgi:VanZ family protein
MERRDRSGRRLLIYLGPLLLWALLLFYFSGGERWRYETTWRLIQHVLAFLCPEYAPPAGFNQVDVSMYQLNGALRRLAHIAGYAILAALTVRFVQNGQPRLKRRSLVAALALGILYTGLDELHRYFVPDRHAKWLDLKLNLVGVALTLGGTLLYFGIKEWERRAISINGNEIEGEQAGNRSQGT